MPALTEAAAELRSITQRQAKASTAAPSSRVFDHLMKSASSAQGPKSIPASGGDKAEPPAAPTAAKPAAAAEVQAPSEQTADGKAADAPVAAAAAGVKPTPKSPLTMAGLRQGESAAAAAATATEPTVADVQPQISLLGALTAEKPAEQPVAVDTTVAGLPAATPEQFLNWLDSIKALGDKLQPAAASADTANAASLKLPGVAAETPLGAAAAVAATSPDLAAPPASASGTGAVIFALPTTSPLPAQTNAVAVAAANLPLAMDQADWPQQLGGEIQWRLGAGIQEARIEISPRELGAVDVRLSMGDKGLSLHLSAAHASTRELLQAELPRLRETLQQGGVLVADAQVGRESPGQSQRRDAAPRGRSDWAGGSDRDAAEAIGGVAPRVQLLRRGLLDDYA